MISCYEHQLFFKSIYLQAQDDSEKKLDINSDSDFLALSLGEVFRAIRALQPPQLDLAPFISRIWNEETPHLRKRYELLVGRTPEMLRLILWGFVA